MVAVALPASRELRAGIATVRPPLRVHLTLTGVTLSSASQVSPFTTPVAASRCRRWKDLTADRVRGPNWPSSAMWKPAP